MERFMGLGPVTLALVPPYTLAIGKSSQTLLLLLGLVLQALVRLVCMAVTLAPRMRRLLKP